MAEESAESLPSWNSAASADALNDAKTQLEAIRVRTTDVGRRQRIQTEIDAIVAAIERRRRKDATESTLFSLSGPELEDPQKSPQWVYDTVLARWKGRATGDHSSDDDWSDDLEELRGLLDQSPDSPDIPRDLRQNAERLYKEIQYGFRDGETLRN